MSGSTVTARLLGATAALLLASACGASGAASPGAGANPVRAALPGGVLGVSKTALGPVLVDARGFTVYLLTADSPGHSSCSAQCLQFWPLVSAPGGTGTPAAQGVGAALGATKATSGASMLTAAGWPLYTFVKDQAPGDINGQGKKSFGGTWYAVSPSGTAITAPPVNNPATTGGAVRGGYGY